MTSIDGHDVHEGDAGIIAIHHASWGMASNDFTEYAFVHGGGLS
jgi:hypothetical protein